MATCAAARPVGARGRRAARPGGDGGQARAHQHPGKKLRLAVGAARAGQREVQRAHALGRQEQQRQQLRRRVRLQLRRQRVPGRPQLRAPAQQVGPVRAEHALPPPARRVAGTRWCAARRAPRPPRGCSGRRGAPGALRARRRPARARSRAAWPASRAAAGRRTGRPRRRPPPAAAPPRASPPARRRPRPGSGAAPRAAPALLQHRPPCSDDMRDRPGAAPPLHSYRSSATGTR